MRYYRIETDEGVRLIAAEGESAYDLTTASPELTSFRELARAAAIVDEPIDDVARRRLDQAETFDLDGGALSQPVIADEVWAAGVTYQISEKARTEESSMPDIYVSVYDADRPEIFFKATPSRTVGPDEAVGIRGDADWNVPEPELGIVLYRGEIVGYTIGNDMSSRDIEGENPLYLPQAKMYDRSCSIGPCVVSAAEIGDPHDLEMSIQIVRDGEVVVEDATSTAELVRTCEELVGYLTRHNAVAETTVLLTGTSLVPPDEFTLEEGDRVDIEIEGIGRLSNPVVRV